MRHAIAGLLYISMAACTGGSSGGVDAAATHDAHAVYQDAPASGSGDSGITTGDAGPCKQASSLHGDGKHNAGMDCMGGCHNHGFSFAGTLYTTAAGTTPVAGATITVVDANGSSQDVITSTNGNFFSFWPVTYPITITASLCPSVQMMSAHPTAGGCNASGCHAPGGVQGTVHL